MDNWTLESLLKECEEIANKYNFHSCSIRVEQHMLRNGKAEEPLYRIFAHEKGDFGNADMFASKTVNSPEAIINALNVYMKSYAKKGKPKGIKLTPLKPQG